MNRASKRLINLTKVTQQISGKVNTDTRLPSSKSRRLSITSYYSLEKVYFGYSLSNSHSCLLCPSSIMIIHKWYHLKRQVDQMVLMAVLLFNRNSKNKLIKYHWCVCVCDMLQSESGMVIL